MIISVEPSSSAADCGMLSRKLSYTWHRPLCSRDGCATPHLKEDPAHSTARRHDASSLTAGSCWMTLTYAFLLCRLSQKNGQHQSRQDSFSKWRIRASFWLPECHHPDFMSSNSATRRQIEVLCLLASGLTSSEAADQLCISEHTVIRHISNMMCVFGAKNRLELLALAISRDAIDISHWPFRPSGSRKPASRT